MVIRIQQDDLIQIILNEPTIKSIWAELGFNYQVVNILNDSFMVRFLSRSSDISTATYFNELIFL